MKTVRLNNALSILAIISALLLIMTARAESTGLTITDEGVDRIHTTTDSESSNMEKNACTPILDFTKRPLNGGDAVKLCDAYRGKVLLIVNTASKCMYTPQYETLEKLYQRYHSEGLVLIGFPSNDFGGQEPGGSEQIINFCKVNYGVSFPMFEKLHAAEKGADPMYRALANAAGGQYPQWNFHKYLIGRDGKLLGSYRSEVEPDSEQLVNAIRKAL